MPAPPLANCFDGGTDGTTITVGNSGGQSGDALSAVTIGLNCDLRFNVDPLSGDMAAHTVMPATAAATYFEWNTFGTLTVPLWVRFYLLKTATPGGTWFYPCQCLTAAVSRSAALAITTGNLLRVDNAAGTSVGTSTIALPSNQWVRVEAKVTPSTTVGVVEYRLYTKDADAPAANYDETKTFSGLVLGANINSTTFGVSATVTNMNAQHWYYDNVALSTVDWLGPAQSSKLFIPARMPAGV